MRIHQESVRSKNRFGHENLLLLGVASLLWFVFRTGTKPSRIAYPCQRAALANISILVSVSIPVLLTAAFLRMRELFSKKGIIVAVLALLIVAATSSEQFLENLPLSGAVVSDEEIQLTFEPRDAISFPASDVYVVNGRDRAHISNLIDAMASGGLDFYSLIGNNDIVIIKINEEWPERGGTNTDVIKELIQAIVDHPAGFTGEIVVADNGQWGGSMDHGDRNNAEDRSQSTQDVVDMFSPMFNVSTFDWRPFWRTQVAEFSAGDMNDGYILYPTADPVTTERVSYPKFTTHYGTHISGKFGIWNGSTYDKSRLKLVNVPVLKCHDHYGFSGAIKHYIGFQAESYSGGLPGSNAHLSMRYGGIGYLMKETIFPTLNIIDAIWISATPGYGGNMPQQALYTQATRVNVLAASTDPVALDYWAAKHILLQAATILGKPNRHTVDPDSTNSTGLAQVAPGVWLPLNRDQLANAGYNVTNDEDRMNVQVYSQGQADRWQMTFDHRDLDHNDVDSAVTWELYIGSQLQTYTEGEYSLSDGNYTLKTYYHGKLINETDLAASTHGNSTIDVSLQMKSHASVSGGYIASNNTVTSLTIVSQTDENLTFVAEGDSPATIIVDVPRNCSYVERDNEKQNGWTYVENLLSSNYTYINVTELSKWEYYFPPITSDVRFITGIVTDSATGLPLQDVEVMSDSFGPVYTLADGTYSIQTGVGVFSVSFSKAGYRTAYTGVNTTAGDISGIDVALTPLPVSYTFGKMSVGGVVNNAPVGYVWACRFQAPDDGVATLISAYLKAYSSPGLVKTMIYSDVDGEVGSLLFESGETPLLSSWTWHNFSASYNLQAEEYYWFAIFSSVIISSRHDPGQTNQHGYAWSWTYPTVPEEFNAISGPAYRSWEDSVYVTYVPAAVRNISGVVSDNATGLPLEGVEVTADSYGPVYTLADGSYSIQTGVGVFSVSFSKAGYRTAYTGVNTTAGDISGIDVALTPLPVVLILSPENRTYVVNDIPLTFIVEEPTSWIGYSLDGQANITLTGNTSLTDLSDGPHRLVVYASSIAGDVGVSEALHFAIDTTSNMPPSNPTVLSPNGGEFWARSQNVTWIASSDPEDALVMYEIEYSLNGVNWTLLASGISDTFYAWNTTLHADSENYLVRVRAYDGLLVSEFDASDSPFTVDNTVPIVEIAYPTEGQVTASGVIWVNGTAAELNKGTFQPSINDERFSLVDWDGTTFRFKNASIVVEGPLAVTVSLTDLAGNTGNATVSFICSSTGVVETDLSVSISISSALVGYKVAIGGHLVSLNGTGIPNAPILVSYRYHPSLTPYIPEDEGWNVISTTATTLDGSYSATWFSMSSGYYVVEVYYPGASSLQSTTNSAGLLIASLDEHVFSVSSNSTISGLSFNSTGGSLIFKVVGPSGTAGYVNMFLAKTLVGDVDELRIYFDGEETVFDTIEAGDMWFIRLTYTHSTHNVEITFVSALATKTPPTPLLAIPLVLLVALSIVLFALKRRKSS